MTDNEAQFAGKVLHGGGPVRFVAPSGVKLDGPLEEAGPIPGTSATAYTLKGREYSVTVSGTGSLRASAPSGEALEDRSASRSRPKPLIYDVSLGCCALTFAMLGVGFVMLFDALLRRARRKALTCRRLSPSIMSGNSTAISPRFATSL